MSVLLLPFLFALGDSSESWMKSLRFLVIGPIIFPWVNLLLNENEGHIVV